MEDLTDEQLLSCPEAIEPTFIHRGRRDSISTQAGKEKQKNRSKCSPIYHQTVYQSISTAIIAKRFSLKLQKFGLSSFFLPVIKQRLQGKPRSNFRGQATWSLAIHFNQFVGHLLSFVMVACNSKYMCTLPTQATGCLSLTLVACHTK